jgi:probable O-glycosylation ligase (exosortase A-associated)
MPIRDIVLTVVVLGLLPACFLRPWIGLLVWTWLGLMNPHLLTWGFATAIPFSAMVAAATLGGVLFTTDRKPLPWTRETIAVIAFWLWTSATTAKALYPVEAWDGWTRFTKIIVMAILVLPFFQDRVRLRWLMVVAAVSIGYYGLKGGIWVLATGGDNRVLGAPGGSFISSNNAIALALNMTLPFLFYLAREEPRRWLRRILYATFFMSIVSVIFTYSRGGFLGLLVVLLLLFGNRRNIKIVVPALALVAIAALWFAPGKLTDRLNTIQNYEADSSANLRLAAWDLSTRLALDHPIFGGGFWSIPQPQIWWRYAPEIPTGGYDAHSIYFNVLGEHGFVGLGLYALMLLSVFATLRQLRRLGRAHEELAWIGHYAFMLRASLASFCVTGAFLSFAYFDLTYLLIMMVIILKTLAAQHLASVKAAASARRPRRPRVVGPISTVSGPLATAEAASTTAGHASGPTRAFPSRFPHGGEA